MSERPGLLERLLEVVGLGRNGGGSAPEPPAAPFEGETPPGCEDVDDIPCEEAVRRVYEYLDGELDPDDAETIRCHVQKCERCYPMYNWEQLFLDALRERGERPEASDDLRRKVTELLDEEAG